MESGEQKEREQTTNYTINVACIYLRFGQLKQSGFKVPNFLLPKLIGPHEHTQRRFPEFPMSLIEKNT